MLVTFLMLASCLLFNDEYFLTIISGIVVVPLIGFIIPLVLDIKNDFH
jgi:hypothetical protein